MHYQGSLDGLCGIYATINAISLMTELDAVALFAHLIKDLQDHLSEIIVRGLFTHEMRRLLNSCRRFCLAQRVSLAYLTCNTSSLDEYWQGLQNHIAVHGAGSVILGVDEHWTCIRRITPKTIMLADSNQWYRLYRRYVSTGTDAQHQVFPKATFLLNAKDIDYERKEKADKEAQFR